jgi:hypothetical protein
VVLVVISSSGCYCYLLLSALSKCKVMVRKELSSEVYNDYTYIVDSLMRPLNYGVNIFLQRGGNLNKLHSLAGLGSFATEEVASLASSCKQAFVRTISGQLGQQLVQQFINGLKTGYSTISVHLSNPQFFRQALLPGVCFWDG